MNTYNVRNTCNNYKKERDIETCKCRINHECLTIRSLNIFSISVARSADDPSGAARDRLDDYGNGFVFINILLFGH